ncbi:MAG: nucleoside-diphosphate-sugar epimerase [Pirellulaceae bacterium]|jgi:nucleoside-diphosphate-sugar epimerase
MKLLITGANGFLGKYVVAAALKRGHEVTAMVRPTSSTNLFGEEKQKNLKFVRADLRNRRSIPDAIRGQDTILHLAASKCGDIYEQMGGTVLATENLLESMLEAEVKHIVAISSFSVYGYSDLKSRSVLTEETAVEPRPETRDAYCQTKLLQENLVRDFAMEANWRWTILRPGVIYGRDNEWTARIGMQLGSRTWVRTGASAQLPLTYVENCAETIVIAAEKAQAHGEILNVVDNETPTQRWYANQVRKRMKDKPRIIPVNWTLMKLIAAAGQLVNKWAFGGRAKTPSILLPAALQARCKPLRYSNQKIRAVLNWEPTFSVTQALDRCFSKDDLYDLPTLPATQETVAKCSPQTQTVEIVGS